VCGETYSAGAGDTDFLLAKITDSLIEKYMATSGNFTFQDSSLTLRNTSLTGTSSRLSVSNAGLTLKTSSLTVNTASLTTDFYPL
ncbi:hypothetical protein, partial [Desulfovibrio piger]|uniref:hypothetical protein n=1 Tax=Desulfovibrio piger TaxID=901 RepID=UPI0026EA51F0